MRPQDASDIWTKYSTINQKKHCTINQLPFIDSIDFKRLERVLDVGCGAGSYLAAFQKEIPLTYGIDLSEKMIQNAHLNTDLLAVSNITNLPFKADTFDLLYSTVVINYVSDWKTPLTEMHRILKKDEYCIITFANRYSVLCPLRHIFTLIGKYTFGKTYHKSNAYIRNIAQIAGFEIVSFKTLSAKTVNSANKPSPLYSMLLHVDMFLQKRIPFWGTYTALLLKKR